MRRRFPARSPAFSRLGADGPLTYSLKTITSALPALTSAGVALTYSVAGNVLTAKAGALTVFTFVLNGATGQWTFDLARPLDHAPGGNENDITINFGSLIRARDKDGDFVDATGSVRVIVDDDVPIAIGDTVSFGIVDEDFVTNGISVPQPGDDGLATAVATGSLTNSSNRAPISRCRSRSRPIRPVCPALTSGGVAVTYTVAGNTLTAKAGANEIFTFVLNSATGAWTFTLKGPVDHDKGGEENDLFIPLGAIIKVTDRDGDSVNLFDGSVSVMIDDDMPRYVAQATQTGTVDEDFVPNGISANTQPGDVPAARRQRRAMCQDCSSRVSTSR